MQQPIRLTGRRQLPHPGGVPSGAGEHARSPAARRHLDGPRRPRQPNSLEEESIVPAITPAISSATAVGTVDPAAIYLTGTQHIDITAWVAAATAQAPAS